jgi:hypothetical protein
MGGWWTLGDWNMRRAYLVRRLRFEPESEATTEMVRRFGYSTDEAKALYDEAVAIRSHSEELAFIAPDPANPNSGWSSCKHEGATLICEAHLEVDPDYVIRRVIFDRGDPAASRLVADHTENGKTRMVQLTPALVAIASGDGLQEVINANADVDLGILVDTARTRERLATPAVLRSTFNCLEYLDGCHDRLFEKADEETGLAGERVTLWKINWQRLESFD